MTEGSDKPFSLKMIFAKPLRWSPVMLSIHLVLATVIFFLDPIITGPLQSVLDKFSTLFLGYTQFFGEIQTAVLLVILLWLMRSKLRKAIWVILVLSTVGGLIVYLLKPPVGRIRPNYSLNQTYFVPISIHPENLDVDTLRPDLYSSPAAQRMDRDEVKDVWKDIKIESRDIPGTESKVVFVGSPSWPSGHAAGAGTNATILTYLFPQGRGLWWFLAISCGLSRIEEKKHFPSDVYFGLIIGHYGTLFVMGFFRRRLQRGAFSSSS